MIQPQNQNPKVLVTGASGFVGSRLVEALLQEGYPVTCLVRKTSNTRTLQEKAVRLVVGDLENPETVREAVRGIDTVYHLAGAIKAADREQYFRINQTGTRLLLEALAETNPTSRRFIHVSSLAAAGPSSENRGRTEKENANPISWYGESKLRSEQEALKYANAFRVTILRPSAVYGPGDRETLMIFRMIKRGWLFTPGRYTRHFSLIHVDDLSAALIQAGRQDTPSGEIFFVSRPESYTWEEVGQSIARALGRTYRSFAFPGSIARMAGFAGDLWASLRGQPATVNSQKIKELLQQYWLCDSSKAKAGLCFSPRIDLEEGIRSTVQWYQAQGWL
jgi:nucleoside-diphosphate-sugar epimerase